MLLSQTAYKDVVEKIEEDYSYNLQGWQTGHEVSLYGNPVTFNETLRYYDPVSASTEARYGGFISETVSSNGSSIRSMQYGYDPLGRLLSAENSAANDSEDFSYDMNGNILSASKTSASNATDTQVFTHDGNRMASLTETSANSTYTYWPNGSLRSDSSQNLQICYNFHNLPSAFVVGSMTTPSAVVTYLWDGTKVRTSSALGQGRLYKGSFVYSVTSTDTQLESIGHDEGRILASEGTSGTEFIDTWHVRDYLGSVRAIYDISTPADEVADVSSQILEQSDYYAFGGRIDVSGQAYAQANRYRYNGKEQLRFESLNLDPGLTDYGARYYRPSFGRWTAIDPMADKYYSVSPYAFCNNNPVNFVDLDGESWGKALKIGNKVRKARKIGRKISVKGILKSEALDVADNVRTIFDSDASVFEKGIAAFDLATGFGDEAKWLAKTVGVSDAIVDGAKVVDGIKFKSFTRGNFRDNLGRLTGEIPKGMQAHHTLPHAFEDKFSDIGINIHDPKYGVWLDSKLHGKLSHKYNKGWETFFKANPNYNVEQVMEHAKVLMDEIYGQ